MTDRTEYHKKYYEERREYLKAIRLKNATITASTISGYANRLHVNVNDVFNFIQQTNNVNK